TVELNTTASIHRQQLAVAKFNQRQVLGTYDELKRAFDDWEKEQTAWEAEGPPLLKSDDGKRIAGDVAQVKRFRGVLSVERPTAEQLAAARQSAEDLITPVRAALANPEDAANPEAGITSTLQTLRTEATKARDSYREARGAVRAMLAGVKGKPPADKTLE